MIALNAKKLVGLEVDKKLNFNIRINDVSKKKTIKVSIVKNNSFHGIDK